MGKPLTDYQVGDAIPELKLPPLTRHTLAMYCGGSGDYNPLHTDIDFARKAGLPDVIGHGMLSMAFLARMLTDFAPQERLRSYGVRFVSMSQIGDEIVCSGKVDERLTIDGEERLRISVKASVGERDLVTGNAVVAVA